MLAFAQLGGHLAAEQLSVTRTAGDYSLYNRARAAGDYRLREAPRVKEVLYPAARALLPA